MVCHVKGQLVAKLYVKQCDVERDVVPECSEGLGDRQHMDGVVAFGIQSHHDGCGHHRAVFEQEYAHSVPMRRRSRRLVCLVESECSTRQGRQTREHVGHAIQRVGLGKEKGVTRRRLWVNARREANKVAGKAQLFTGLQRGDATDVQIQDEGVVRAACDQLSGGFYRAGNIGFVTQRGQGLADPLRRGSTVFDQKDSHAGPHLAAELHGGSGDRTRVSPMHQGRYTLGHAKR